ncbi:hypothetical protein [Phenylobacterium sp.]|uniref:hypothetical protein n=1 Tax=Phenylobacterium sp. TaxID=1871053 RepID=UPI0025D8BD17|nr:hypothetical protein [Phenylobacterium sp.]MBX3482455.1 hypothetical protein [Phenylobacterium sp.]
MNGDKVGAMVDGMLEGPDSFLVAGAAKGALKKGGAKYLGPYDWHTPPWKQPGTRRWLEENGFVNPGEQGHHWAIPQNGWGKNFPDFIKNQPWNIKGLDPIIHRRVHSRAKVDGEWLPKFNALEQLWYGTPAYFKAMIMKGATDLSRRDEQQSLPRKPEPPRATSYQRR